MLSKKSSYIQLPKHRSGNNDETQTDSSEKYETNPANSKANDSGPENCDSTRSAISTKLLSSAQTMLRGATILRESESQVKDEMTQPGVNVGIKTVVNNLHREKTLLLKQSTQPDSSDDDDEEEELKHLIAEMNTKSKKIAGSTDSDFDTDLEDEIKTVSSTPSQWSTEKLYEKTCKKLGIRPVPLISQALKSGREVEVRNRAMDALDMLSLANALISNSKVSRLALDGNKIGDEGAQVVAWLLKTQESFIDHLSLCDNGIGGEGIVALGEMLQQNKTLTVLNLSGNKAHDTNVQPIADALYRNHKLINLNLSHNHIGDIGAHILAPAIATNETLVTLDLSWNKIRPSGGVAICSAIKENIVLKSINLAMNGLSTPGAMFIGDILEHNQTLTYLNVTFNRIFDEGAAFIAKGLRTNEALHHLIIHDNPITATGALTLVESIRDNTNTAMWKLDLHTTPVIQKIVKIADDIQEQLGDFDFRYGGVVDSEVPMIGEPNQVNNKNPMSLVKEYIENEGLRMVDFFKQMDKDHGGSISRDEFVYGLTEANVPLSQAQVDRLINMLDKDGDGEIDYRELIEGDREFRRKQRQRRDTEQKILKEHLTKLKAVSALKAFGDNTK